MMSFIQTAADHDSHDSQPNTESDSAAAESDEQSEDDNDDQDSEIHSVLVPLNMLKGTTYHGQQEADQGSQMAMKCFKCL